jgi:hypothetical protein
MIDKEQWFFFIPRQESEVRGGRPRRLTTTGYWKATGSPNHVYSSDNRVIGMKRTMVFYCEDGSNNSATSYLIFIFFHLLNFKKFHFAFLASLIKYGLLICD